MPLIDNSVQHVESALIEVRSRLAEAEDAASRQANLDEALAVAVEDGLDLLEAIGRASDVSRFIGLSTLHDRFSGLRELLEDQRDEIAATSADAGLEARFSYCFELLRGLERVRS